MTVITNIGVEILKEKITNKKLEVQDLLNEIKILRESSSSTDDNPEVGVLTNRYEKAMQEEAELRNTLSNSRIIEVGNLRTDKVAFGNVVEFEDLETGEVFTYRIVSPIESDIAKGLISYESPIGASMIGLEVGDTFDFERAGNLKEYEILSITSKEI